MANHTKHLYRRKGDIVDEKNQRVDLKIHFNIEHLISGS